MAVVRDTVTNEFMLEGGALVGGELDLEDLLEAVATELAEDTHGPVWRRAELADNACFVAASLR